MYDIIHKVRLEEWFFSTLLNLLYGHFFVHGIIKTEKGMDLWQKKMQDPQEILQAE